MSKRCALMFFACLPLGAAIESGPAMAGLFTAEVDLKLSVPEAEQARYGQLLGRALEPYSAAAGPQYTLIVDKSPLVQALLIYWQSPEGQEVFIGAAPVSTGKTGRVDYFETPVGVFIHSVQNPDFRALGTKNSHGVRGYGSKGMRIFDFGWQKGKRGWGRGGESPMRLQMHATDPDYMEPRLSRPDSKGCVRIPATLNHFLDHHGVLDAEYEQEVARGNLLWVLAKDREPTPWPGRYMVIVDTAPAARPDWAVRPPAPARKPK